jgi:phenylpyruvate tautomerase PptA (4-oxalocrotonate tautomerase family)
MPILDVEIVLADTERLDEDLPQRLADVAGEIFGAPAGRMWVRMRGLPLQNYAESGGLPAGVRPVFASVLKAKYPSLEDLRGEIAALTEAVARICDRPPENVHIFYRPEGIGRVAFGGELASDR